MTIKTPERIGHWTDKPCDVCGVVNQNQLEPRFYYSVCADHVNVSAVEVSPIIYAKKPLDHPGAICDKCVTKTRYGVSDMTRKISKNIYGNWVGYVGKKREVEFGECEVCAKYWLETGDADWFTNAWL